MTPEAKLQAEVRFRASQLGWRLWRNNVGVAYTREGKYTCRYGIANDSPGVNSRLKSSDLIGIRPVLITPDHVGQVIGQFASGECKRPGWRYTGTPREVAQLRWIELIIKLGGWASFIDTVDNIG